MNAALRSAAGLLRDAAGVYALLLKTMIPVLILTRVAERAGVMDDLGHLLSPLMGLVGLPGELALPLITTMVVGLYPGGAVFVAVAPDLALTGAQVSVLGGMMLIAHALPLEQAIVRCAGPSLWFSTGLRILGAFAFGALLDLFCRATGWLGGPAPAPLWTRPGTEVGWLGWAASTVLELAAIYGILVGLMVLMAAARRVGLVDLLGRLLAPLLRLLGLGPDVAPLTLAGVLLGITYGGSLIIAQARSGKLSRRDILVSLSLLCLLHSVIEDSLIVIALGADPAAVILCRVVFSIAVVAALARLLDRLPDPAWRRLMPAHRDGMTVPVSAEGAGAT
jgi:hypothetical protein